MLPGGGKKPHLRMACAGRAGMEQTESGDMWVTCQHVQLCFVAIITQWLKKWVELPFWKEF